MGKKHKKNKNKKKKSRHVSDQDTSYVDWWEDNLLGYGYGYSYGTKLDVDQIAGEVFGARYYCVGDNKKRALETIEELRR